MSSESSASISGKPDTFNSVTDSLGSEKNGIKGGLCSNPIGLFIPSATIYLSLLRVYNKSY